MPRHRSPEPRPLKLLKGETRPSRVPSSEPEAEPGAVRCPDWLGDDAAAIWASYADELQVAGLLRPRNIDMFAVFCSAISEWRKAAHVMAMTGPIIKGRDQAMVSNPASREFARYSEIVRRYAIEFGMTPGAVTAMGRQLEDGRRARSDMDPARLLS